MPAPHARVLCSLLLLAACGPLDDVRAHALGESEQGLMVCPTTYLEGVDVYSGDGNVNWTSVKSSGRDFAFVKATQAGSYVSSQYKSQFAGARDAGLVRGPYHFFDATVDGVAQANHFLSVVNDAGLLDDDMPAMLDLECPSDTTEASSSQTCEGSTSGWAPAATVRQRALDWLQTVEAATGKTPIIYSYVSWFGTQGFTQPSLTHYPLYIASLSNTCATVPAPWTTPVFWQYNQTGTVPGFAGTGDVDMDRFLGDLAELHTFAKTASDAGERDGGATDSGIPDSGTPDARTHDAGVQDAGSPDAGAVDSGSPVEDSGMPDDDAGTPPDDAGTMMMDDAGTQMPLPDAGMTPPGTGSPCGCGSAPGTALIGLLLLFARRARRSFAKRSVS